MAGIASVLALVLWAATETEALHCYACVPNQQIAGVQIPAAIANKTSGFPRCSALSLAEPALRFEMTCPAGLDRSCIKIRDDSGNEMRSCFSTAISRCTKTSKKGQVLCTCKNDLCNAAGKTAPAAASLALALALTSVCFGRHTSAA
ncbi:uncharacterized protein LOC119103727 [Pollicipes pollicipes]|uniref:uncharacterized protein LOC119103727 n=1 Tax=Pollicipes pollicipes TaxID=41117 RepID=UPI001884C9E8|nr:uncharacterized protein LOC119103727 [Pollicipes pollicipes]